MNYSVPDIQKLDIISLPENQANDVGSRAAESKVMVKRPIAKRVGRSISESASPCMLPVAASAQFSGNVRKTVEILQPPLPEAQPTNGRLYPGLCNYYQ